MKCRRTTVTVAFVSVFTSGLAWANCWIAASPDYCCNSSFFCGSPAGAWGCAHRNQVGGPYLVSYVAKATQGTGKVGVWIDSEGTCTHIKVTCGTDYGECVIGSEEEIECMSTYPYGAQCQGGQR